MCLTLSHLSPFGQNADKILQSHEESFIFERSFDKSLIYMESIDERAFSPFILILIILFCLNAFSYENVASSTDNQLPVFKTGFLIECIKDNSTTENLRYCAGTLAFISMRYANQQPEDHTCETLKTRYQTLEQMKAEFQLITNQDKSLPPLQNYELAFVYIESIDNVLQTTAEDYLSFCDEPLKN